MNNNFGEIVSSLLTADHTCRRSEDESWEGHILYNGFMEKLSKQRSQIKNVDLFAFLGEDSTMKMSGYLVFIYRKTPILVPRTIGRFFFRGRMSDRILEKFSHLLAGT